jgi:hypothetical protein
MAFRLMTRGAAWRLAILAGALVVGLATSWWIMIRMPGRSHSGPLPALSAEDRALAERLEADVTMLAGTIGIRNRYALANYERAAAYIEARLIASGYTPARQPSPPRLPSLTPGNIWAEIRGTTEPERIVIVGAHYDSFADSPGANDNGTGVAAVLALADRLADSRPAKTLRFCLFVDEEPPYFQTEEMGSLVYARGCAERGEQIDGMISVETIGWYTNDADSQRYPAPLSAVYPNQGNFVGFVGNVASRRLLHEVIASFRETTAFPSEGAALPAALPGISWSDHWAFWQTGVPALMATDTAPFRYPHYHTPEDTPDKVHPEAMARVVRGIERVLRRLAAAEGAAP